MDIPEGTWKVVSPETADRVSAVAFYFAREVQHDPCSYGTGRGCPWWNSRRGLDERRVLRPLKDFDIPLAEPSQSNSGLNLIKLGMLLPFHFGFRGSACSFQSSGKSSMSFDICRIARHRFLVALNRVSDLTL